ncbi:MAG: 1-acyl-sn-glycerol-3-phosphate acyltransferase [Syntrophobacterales bacterium]|jgi:1-acyl-sn-glycerol-3-phosphate acyltransferase|nr:1-acyl-sn-glycerol-3-phosphate acyltransferase [Syntrophobacterales bacterium]
MDRGMARLGFFSILYSIPMNIIVYPMIVLWTLLGILMLPVFFGIWKVIADWDNSRIMQFFIWIYGKGWVAIMLPFVRFSRTGFTRDLIGSSYVMVINHLSFFDFYCMGYLPFRRIAAAVRSWPFRMPWYAPFMRLAGYLDVESLGPVGSVSVGADILSKGGSVLFYPEGHRSKDGTLQRFFSGAFKLSVETGAKILPLCLTGTDVLLPPGRWWMLPARVCLVALPPIDPGNFAGPLAHIEMRKYTRAVMTEAVQGMRQW